MGKMTPLQMWQTENEKGYIWEWIQGKYFRNGEELVDPVKQMTRELSHRYTINVPDTSWVEDKFMQTVRVMSDKDKSWGLPWRVKTAMKFMQDNPDYVPHPVYPLHKEQYQMMNYILTTDELDPDIYFILMLGEGGTGKSSYLNIIQKILGYKDCVGIQVNDLDNSKTKATLIGKRLAYSDDEAIGEWNERVISAIKTVTRHNTESIDPKYGKRYDAQFRCKLMICSNGMPRTNALDSGLIRRFLIFELNERIPFDTKGRNFTNCNFTEEELRDFIIASLKVDMTNWAEPLLENTKRLILKNNSVAMFYEEDYDKYVDKCYKSGLKPYGKPNWQELKGMFESWNQNTQVLSDQQTNSQKKKM